MTLTLYDTLTRKKAPFEPLDPNDVRMYVCGPTVYDLAHIGNARPVVAFDVLYRLLRHLYGDDHVTYARNITDVDDKIITAAKENGEDIDDLTERTAAAFHEDMAALGALEPTVEPRCTRHIPQMVAMIEALIDKGCAYEADGHVLFRVKSMAEYGALSGRNRDEMVAGARVEVAPYKEDPADFVLWKPSTEDQPGWDSPWGKGRPGWHIECSAMSAAHLGAVFDIHGGGLDLVFPHHENELAQSRCAHGTELMARVWMHNGYVMVEGEKMSKSLGNFFTVRELLEEGWPGEVIRLVLLKTHYRQPLDFTRAALEEAKAELDRFYILFQKLGSQEIGDAGPPEELLKALSDDLNTPAALAHLHERLRSLNRNMGKDGWTADHAPARDVLIAGGKLLGLFREDPVGWFRAASGDEAAEIDALIAERQAARKSKNFDRADAIRDELAARGIVLEDGPQGTTWRRAG